MPQGGGVGRSNRVPAPLTLALSLWPPARLLRARGVRAPRAACLNLQPSHLMLRRWHSVLVSNQPLVMSLVPQCFWLLSFICNPYFFPSLQSSSLAFGRFWVLPIVNTVMLSLGCARQAAPYLHSTARVRCDDREKELHMRSTSIDLFISELWRLLDTIH